MVPFAFWKTSSLTGWAWMNSYKDEYFGGSFGTQGTGSTVNFPGSRWYAGRGVEPSTGNLWVFGGWGNDVHGDSGFLSDLWKYEISTGKWTWMKGSQSWNGAGTCGTKGTANAANVPGSREDPFMWVDASGNLWLFGGVGVDCSGNSWAIMNDLWKYDVSTGNWTWMSGSSTGGVKGTYGTKGTGSTANIPGGRGGGAGFSNWIDSSGNLWLFGGQGLDSAGTNAYLNDLWRYEVSTGKWTWYSGATTVSQVGTYGTKGTGSTANVPGARADATGWLDSTGGFIWLLGGNAWDSASTFGMANDLWKYEISTGKWTWVTGANTVGQAGTWGTQGTASTANTPGSLSMARVGIDSAGNAWIFGGYDYDSSGFSGEMNAVWRYRPGSNDWTWVSGSNIRSKVGTYGTQGVASTGNVSGGRTNGLVWMDFSDNLWMYSGSGLDSIGGSRVFYLNDIWKYNTTNAQWTWMSGPNAYYNVYFQSVSGIPDSPGARKSAVTLVDSSGNFWMFGGYGPVDRGSEPYGAKNDLWKYNPTTGIWSFITGGLSDYNNPGATYGTKGVASTANLPGARSQFAGWIDGSGIFWFFGGVGYNSTGAFVDLNDLWKYDPSNSQWTWVGGAKTGSVKGTYGTKGTGSTANIPGVREAMGYTKDSSGNFWLFGGGGWDSTTSGGGYLGDLWKYNPTNGQWTWMSGSNIANGNGTYGTKGVASTANTPGARTKPAMWADASGNIWLFGGGGYDGVGGVDVLNDLWKFDPAASTWTWVSGANTAGPVGTYGTLGVGSTSNTPGGHQYSAHWSDSSGNLWLFGGTGYSNPAGIKAMAEVNDVWKYNISSGQWTWMGGANTNESLGSYNLPVGSINAANVPGARQEPTYWQDGSGNFWLYGGWGWGANGAFGMRSDFWKFKPQ